MILFSICDIPWWLLWLLPLLLAALLWWWQNNKYNKMVADYEDKIKGLNGRISALEDDLIACKSKRSELEGDLALTKGRMREMENEMKKMSDASAGDGASISAAMAGSASLGALSASMDAEEGAEDDAEHDAEHGAEDATEFGAEDGAGEGTDEAGSIDAASLGLGAITSSLAGSGGSESASGGAAGGSGGSAAGAGMYAKVKSDNLQIIEGIGPKMESILKENGINSHSELGSKSLDELQTILNKYGDRYKIIDPKTWAQQAKMAGDGDFDGLISLQKNLSGNKGASAGPTDSKLEKYLIKIGVLKAFKQDDLKAIEGIGPATDKLLGENGINTWRDLANTSADRLREILTAAGSRFALGDPTTWPRQAELAADGKFDELRAYQDELDGGEA